MDCIANFAGKQAIVRGDAPELAQSGAPRGALVNIAKSSDIKREVIDQNTGEIQGFRLDRKRSEYVLESDPLSARFERFALQGSAKRLFPSERVSRCLRTITNTLGHVAVLKNAENGKCHFDGLQTCSSVWMCPVCAAKIAERRKLEVRLALDTHLQAGGGVEMVTLTFSHSRTDLLADLMAKLRESMKVLKRGRSYRKVKMVFESVGSIRALEITWGEANGWHPHFHEIWLFSKVLTVGQRRLIRGLLFDGWKSACISAGLPAPNRKRGVHIQPAECAADYIAKFGTEPRWEAASELTKQHVKKSRDSKGRTPFDLLRDYSNGCKRAGALFSEFAKALKGFRQLYWSNGLKAIFGIDEYTDAEIAARKDAAAKPVCKLQPDEWRRVLSMPYDARATILALGETGGYDAIQRFLAPLFPADWVPMFHILSRVCDGKNNILFPSKL